MQDNKNVDEFQTLLTKMDLKSLLALQVMISQQALSVALAQGSAEPIILTEKSSLIKPNNKLVM